MKEDKAKADKVTPKEETPAEMSEEEVRRVAKDIWTDYLSLTKELLKFIDQQEIETFMQIVEHRARLIEKIEELPSKDYRKLDEFKAIADQIKPLDREIMYKARGWLHKSRRQNSVVRSYDLGNSLAMTQSVNFNKKY